MTSFKAEITIPPSLNGMYINVPGQGRAPSGKYKKWKKTAGWELRTARIPSDVICGRYRLTVQLPHGMAGDVDNRIKAVSDLLVSLSLTPDDRHAISVYAEKSTSVPPGRCIVQIESAP